MENYGKNYERGLIQVHTDYSIQRYSPDLERIKTVPKRPLTKKEQKLILELDFPALSKIYAQAFSSLLSSGETLDDLMQETYFKLPVFFARYDKSFLTPAQRKDIKQVRKAFMGWFRLTSKQYRDKTYESLKLYRDTKYGNGQNQLVVLPENYYDSLNSISNEEILKQRFLDIRRALWAKLPAGPSSRYEKDPAIPEIKAPGRSNLQAIVDMKDEGATIATIRFQFSQFGWSKDEQKEVLQIIEKYLDRLWEKTHNFTGQVHTNWASEWLDAIEDRTETTFIKSQNKTSNRKRAA